MTDLSKTILKKYQVRKTKKQKLAFIKLLQQYFPELKLQIGGFPKNRNIILGDIRSSRIILSAHYDTCAWLPFPNLITPKNLFAYLLYSVAIMIPFLIAGLLIHILSDIIFKDYLISYIISLVYYFTIIYLMFAGPANKHTANDNTSGVITLLEIYQAMSPQQRAYTAIVLFDNEELGLVGSSYFKFKYKKQVNEKLLINYDCVSDGDHIMIGISKKARPAFKEKFQTAFKSTENKNIIIENAERLLYPSDQSNFSCTAAIAALNKNKILGYYMNRIHTNRDTVFDVANINLLKDNTIDFLSQL